MTRYWQLGIAAFVLTLSAVFFVGMMQLPEETGYAGIGPRFMPTLVASFLALMGLLLLLQALTGGFRSFTDVIARVPPDLRGGLWVSAGILLMAALITRIGFVPAATLLFVCVARGFGSLRPGRDGLIGAALVLPVFWLFTLLLDVNLPRFFNDWL